MILLNADKMDHTPKAGITHSLKSNWQTQSYTVAKPQTNKV